MGKIPLQRSHIYKNNLKQVYLMLSKYIYSAGLSQNKNSISNDILNKSTSPNGHLLTNSFAEIENDKNNKRSLADVNDSPPTLPEGQCCEEGCQNCVWLEYVIKLKFHSGDQKKVKEAINLIPNSDVRAFVAFEMQGKLKDR